MSTTAVLRNAASTRWDSGDFAGTGLLLRLYLRRDRVVLPLWMLLLSVPLAPVYIGSIDGIYPDAAGRAQFVESIRSSPAQQAMYGPVYDSSLGAVGIWKAGIYYTIIAVAVILTVIRHTRADEESGRAELVGATSVGRQAALMAAVLLGFGASLGTGLLGAASLATVDVPKSGSLAFGLALAASGMVFTAVAALAAQLSASARTARGIAFAVLGTCFALRAVGDAGSQHWLSWLSPLGWSLQVRPYAGDRWPVLLLPLATTVVLVAVALTLARRRDLGAGLIAQRPGAATAAPSLSGVFGLAWRLHRGGLLGWTVGLCLYGLLAGSVVHGIGDEIGGAGDLVTRLGGTSSLEDSFVRLAFVMLGIGASGYGVSAVLRMHGEENAERAETVLAGAVSRTRWAASHLGYAIFGPVIMLLTAGLVAGASYALSAGDAGKLTDTVGAAAVQLPAVWIPAAAAVALFGALPRFTPVAWAVLTALIALYLLGSISGAPQWLLDLAPYNHLPPIPGGAFDGTGLVWLTVIDAALIAAGLVALCRRDLR